MDDITVMEQIDGFSGSQYVYTPDASARKEYDQVNVEYATSSFQTEHDMFPGLIAAPINDRDIQLAIKYANERKYPVSIMSGGHQYCGACSTNPNGIQLNLQSTYQGPQDLVRLPPLPAPNENKTLVYASVSYSISEFNAFLAGEGLFVPHGQCGYVHLGGHVQTGGYGQLARSFGLLGDHVWGVRMICYDGTIQEITRDFKVELLNAILGGSPGNFGVITHYTIEVYRDEDYNFPETGAVPHGYKAIWLYNAAVLTALLGEVAAMGDDPEFPRNFDLCVSVVSHSYRLFHLEPDLKDHLDELYPDDPDNPGDEPKSTRETPGVVVLYAQWVPMSKDDLYTPAVDAWFQKFRDIAAAHRLCIAKPLIMPMSKMTGQWLFTAPREFDYPYDKRAYLTNSHTLAQDKWVDVVVPQISDIVKINFLHPQKWNNCFLSVQIQCFGGNNSQFFVNRNNGTSYSWRDSTVGQTLDCFHTDTDLGKQLAQDWQATNDSLMVGAKSSFSTQDRRLLWASYGNWVMDDVWQCYYDDQEKYERIGRQRAKADPLGTFTANPFNVACVKTTET